MVITVSWTGFSFLFKTVCFWGHPFGNICDMDVKKKTYITLHLLLRNEQNHLNYVMLVSFVTVYMLKAETISLWDLVYIQVSNKIRIKILLALLLIWVLIFWNPHGDLLNKARFDPCRVCQLFFRFGPFLFTLDSSLKRAKVGVYDQNKNCLVFGDLVRVVACLICRLWKHVPFHTTIWELSFFCFSLICMHIQASFQSNCQLLHHEGQVMTIAYGCKIYVCTNRQCTNKQRLQVMQAMQDPVNGSSRSLMSALWSIQQ